MRPEFVVRFRWNAGDIAMWDNRATAHLAPEDIFETEFDRQLYRITLVGDVPVARGRQTVDTARGRAPRPRRSRADRSMSGAGLDRARTLGPCAARCSRCSAVADAGGRGRLSDQTDSPLHRLESGGQHRHVGPRAREGASVRAWPTRGRAQPHGRRRRRDGRATEEQPADGYSLGLTISHAYTGNPVVSPGAARYGVGRFHASGDRLERPVRPRDEREQPLPNVGRPHRGGQTRRAADLRCAIPAHEDRRRLHREGRGREVPRDLRAGRRRDDASDLGRPRGLRILGRAAHRSRGGRHDAGARVDRRPAAGLRAQCADAQGAGYDLASCALFVVSAPPGLPADIKGTLSTALAAAIDSPEMTALIRGLRYPEYHLGPDAVTAVLETEAQALARAVAQIAE